MPTATHHYSVSSLYQQQRESMKGFLSKRWSFWLALFSCIAFLVGNMVGQHGWRVFWKSVWGQEAQIVFEGTVAPISRVPDPERWNTHNHEFSYVDVPQELLVNLPEYLPVTGCGEGGGREDRRIYSVSYMGDYNGGGDGCGSHPGVDILAPRGTPVVAVANGKVMRIEQREWGFGNTVVLEIPNAPHPDYPDRTTMLTASYGHLDKILVGEGDMVYMGQMLGTVGQTGFATAPHLDFQITKKEAPYAPFWSFTTAEANIAGLSFIDAVNAGLGKERAAEYAVSPMLYVQEYQDWSRLDRDQIAQPPAKKAIRKVVTAMRDTVQVVVQETHNWVDRSALRKEARLKSKHQRIARNTAPKHVAQANVADVVEEVVLKEVEPSPNVMQESAESREISTAPTGIPMPKAAGQAAAITVFHDGAFDGGWEKLVLFARDAQGNFMHDVQFDGDLYLEASFGEAEFSPAALTQEQFDDRGRAFVRMLPRGFKTVIPVVRGAFSADGEPMVSERTVSVRSVAGQEG